MNTRSSDARTKTITAMGTFVTVQVTDGGLDPHKNIDAADAIERALDWFRRIEACCSRFDPDSELMQLTARRGVAVPVSAMLFTAVRFALAVAEEAGGAFDPTVGHVMEAGGFDRHYQTGQIVRSDVQPDGRVSYRDVQIDPERNTITLLRPLVLDLGAVAKGLAIDLAAHELRAFEGFAIDAGGDLYLGGVNAGGQSWSIGIRHPRLDHALIDAIRVSNAAVCTSGDYERTAPEQRGHHIIDARTGAFSCEVASVTVVAPTAMLADALGTAAFVLGPDAGMRLLERHDVNGLMVLPSLERRATRGMYDLYGLGHGTAAALG